MGNITENTLKIPKTTAEHMLYTSYYRDVNYFDIGKENIKEICKVYNRLFSVNRLKVLNAHYKYYYNMCFFRSSIDLNMENWLKFLIFNFYISYNNVYNESGVDLWII